MKRITDIPEKRNTAETIKKRLEYAFEFSSIDEDKLIFIDEMGISLSSRNKMGRALIGQQARRIVASIRSENITVTAAMSKRKLIFFSTKRLAIDTSSFKDFLAGLFEEFSKQSLSNIVLVMDNLKVHHTQEIRQFVIENNHRLMYLPPYSPFLNPIEELFSKWKRLVQSITATSREELLNNLKFISERISASDCQGWFQHMKSYLPRCLGGLEILN